MWILDIAVAKYAESLQSNPIQTKSSTAGVTMALGEAIAQYLGHKRMPDLNRCATMALFGILWSGPSNHYWNLTLEKLLKNQKPGAVTLTTKVILDQLIYGPLCNILILLWRIVLFSSPDDDFKSILKKIQWQLKYVFPGVQLNAWKIWPLAALINYQLVPVQYRSLFMNMVGLCWTIILVLRVREGTNKKDRKKKYLQQQQQQEQSSQEIGRAHV
eukprot:TRINITY_DN567_c2_g3_i1.p2 TRINITY_DN567_c2_g3~~TRINITY_DN567_c2_g3_i1.p2  ORF type:complete len:216 (+),score=13.43 TRINITY_DN567_c2_g3_i1:22-669(+)